MRCIKELNLDEGMKSLSRWGDNISKTVGESLYIKEKDGIPGSKETGYKRTAYCFSKG